MSTMTAGISDEDRARIVAWARKHPEIRAVYLYGSRARGDNQPDSDIDLAIVLHQQRGDSDTLTTWIFWQAAWKKNPDLRLSQPVDMQWYEKGAGLERVGPGVERDGILLYSIK
jgi:hypothetical protein